MKRILLLIALISGLSFLSSCKKGGDDDVTYYLAFYQTADYVSSNASNDIKLLINDTVESWKKGYELNWEADPGRSQSEQDAEAVQYMEDAYVSFSKVAAKLRTDILAMDPNAVLTLSWMFEAIRKDGKATRLSSSRKVEILHGDQGL